MRIVPQLYGGWAVEAYGSAPNRVDALTFHTSHLSHLKATLDTLRKECGSSAGGSSGSSVAAAAQYLPAAFVTFRSRWSAAVAASCLHSHDAGPCMGNLSGT